MIRPLKQQFFCLNPSADPNYFNAASLPPTETVHYRLYITTAMMLDADEARRLRDWLNIVVPDEMQIWRPENR